MVVLCVYSFGLGYSCFKKSFHTHRFIFTHSSAHVSLLEYESLLPRQPHQMHSRKMLIGRILFAHLTSPSLPVHSIVVDSYLRRLFLHSFKDFMLESRRPTLPALISTNTDHVLLAWCSPSGVARIYTWIQRQALQGSKAASATATTAASQKAMPADRTSRPMMVYSIHIQL